MRVIVTKTLKYQYTQFICVSSLREVLKLQDVECIVLHSCEDKGYLVGSIIDEINKKFNCLFFYINSKPDRALEFLITGISGYVIEDDYYYEDEADLSELINSYKGESETALAINETKGNLDIVKNFVDAFVAGDEKCSLPFFIQRTNTAVSALESCIGKQELRLQDMSSAAVETFSRVGNYLCQMQSEMQKWIKRAEAAEQQQNAPRNKFGSGGISLFPKVNYNPSITKRVLVIREFSPCRYLTSFMLSYQSYLNLRKNKRVKVVFVVQKGKSIYTKYASNSNFTFISQESEGRNELYDHDIIFTNSPKSQVLQKIIDTGTYDIVLVVDRLYGGDVILDGHGIKHLAAVGGSTDLQRFKLPPSKCIFSYIGVPNAFLVIPAIPNYPAANAVEMRVSVYAQACQKQKLYDIMDSYVELNARG